MAKLPDNLQAWLKELVTQQQSGKFADRMGYSPSRGMHVVLIAKEGGGEETACEGITRNDLRKLQAAGLISINTPRATWALRLRAAANDAAA